MSRAAWCSKSTWQLIAAANRYADQTEPWRLAARPAGDRSAAQSLNLGLYTLADTIRAIALLLLLPFLPSTAERILTRLG
jgi:methionyl-tRNA synthetase